MLSFVARRGISVTAGRLTFNADLPSPCTAHTSTPFIGPGIHAFEVQLPVKQARTAIGFTAEPYDTYLTPSYSKRGSRYVSMGGAGFIYPEARASGSSYGEGDVIKCEINFSSSTVAFFINGRPAGTAPWNHGSSAYPSISSEGGPVVCSVTFS